MEGSTRKETLAAKLIDLEDFTFIVKIKINFVMQLNSYFVGKKSQKGFKLFWWDKFI
ncbi:MAG: hypothetical protein L0Y77_05740 [Chlorobi bacterium]|nr:hypothetical protein [Chlorobiota bacterium]